MSLELQRCGIRCVGKLVDMLPELVHKTKRFNLEGNDLSAKNVRKLVDAMTAAYAYIRPSWLSIGPDAQAAAATCFTETLCHPHHPRGCLCLKPGVVHVVRTLPKYDAVARAAWEEEHLRPLEPHLRGASDLVTAPRPPRMDDWTAPLSALKQRPLTPTTAASSCGGSPRERNIADERRDISRHAGGSKFANKIAPASKGTDAHLAQAACAASPPEALVAYVRLEKRAHDMEIISRLADSGSSRTLLARPSFQSLLGLARGWRIELLASRRQAVSVGGLP